MNITVPIMLVGWLPLMLLVGAIIGARRTILVSFVGGGAFLPVAGYDLPFFQYDKRAAIMLGALLCALLYDARHMFAVRWRWFDLPVVVWCLLPLASSVSNGLGAYDGVVNIVARLTIWGIPYALGRAYFADRQGLREVAFAIIIGCLLYVPFCIFEMRMSPYLHKMLYGFHQSGFVQTKRFGGFRPMVFMDHGLVVAIWMATATLIAGGLWVTGAARRIGAVPLGLATLILAATLLLSRSAAAIVVASTIGLLLIPVLRLRSKACLAMLVAIIVAYPTSRLVGYEPASILTLTDRLPADRARSLQVRVDAERLLIDRAMIRPALGWAGWGRSRVRDDRGRDLAITDSAWVIALGQSGFSGFVAYLMMLTVPMVLVLMIDRDLLFSSAGRLVLVVCIGLLAYALDKMLNAMPSPFFLLMSGSLVTQADWLLSYGAARPVQRSASVT